MAMRTRDDILTEVDYLALITRDCSQASQRIASAAKSLELGAPLLMLATGAQDTRRIALEVAFEELREAQDATHSLIRLVEGRLRMITGELE